MRHAFRSSAAFLSLASLLGITAPACAIDHAPNGTEQVDTASQETVRGPILRFVTGSGYLVNRLSGRCLDVAGAPGTADGAVLQLHDCEWPTSGSGAPARTDQVWEVTSTGFIRNKLSGKCIDVAGEPGTANEARLRLWSCELSGTSSNGSKTDQVWRMNSDGFIRNDLSGKCLDIVGLPGTQNDARAQLWDCEVGVANTDQTWKLVGGKDCPNACGEHASCTTLVGWIPPKSPDVPALPIPGPPACRCDSAFEGDGQHCMDKDECLDPKACGENTKCVNVVGSYRCDCSVPGMVSDGFACHCPRGMSVINGQCTACGQPGQVCCQGTCGTSEAVCNAASICESCGGDGQPCCFGSRCNNSASACVSSKCGPRLGLQILPDYPRDIGRDWSDEAQGLAHDDKSWFFSQKSWLYKWDIGTTDPAQRTGVSVPAPYDHFGDIDHHNGRIYAAMNQQNTNNAAVGVFDATSLAYLGRIIVADDAPWVAVDHATGDLYVGAEGHPLRIYHGVQSTGPGRVDYVSYREQWLHDENGNRLDLWRQQGGVFSPSGHLYIIAENFHWIDGPQMIELNGQVPGVHAFDLKNGRRWTFAPISYDRSRAFGAESGQELEGADWVDWSNAGHGQLHVMMIDNDLGNDAYWLHHFTAAAPYTPADL